MRFLEHLLVVVVMLLGLIVASFAQTPVLENVTPQALITAQKPVIDKFDKEFTSALKQFDASSDDSIALNKLRLHMQDLNAQLLQTGLLFRAPLNDINLRLDQLGVAQNGVEEAQSVIDERAALRDQKAEINALVGKLEDIALKSNHLIDTIAVQTRELFSANLTRRVEYNPALLDDIYKASIETTSHFTMIVKVWWHYVMDFKLLALFAAILIPLFVALGLLFLGRRLVGRSAVVAPVYEDGKIPYFKRLTVAFLSAFIPLISVFLFVAATLVLLRIFGVLQSDVRPMFHSAGLQIVFVFFVTRMGTAIFSPHAPEWQLVHIAPRPARALVFLMSCIALVIGIESWLSTVYRVVAAPIALTMLKSFVIVMIVGMLIVAISFIRPRITVAGRSIAWPWWVRGIILILALVPVGFALAGYIGLARYLTQQIVVSGAFLVLMYLGIMSAKAITEEGSFGQMHIGQLLHSRFGVDNDRLDQYGLLVGIILGFVIILVCIPPIALQIGFSWNELVDGFIRLLTGFQIGSISISPMAILTGIGFFLVAWLLMRWFISWLDGTVLARSKVDSGVRNSIRTVVGYCAAAVAALIGLSVAGFNLSSLALIAGGLSLGIGFGLQNIVQNFVSGLILLAERPFKVGDYIETGSTSGIVRRISVRATEVETFKRQTIIVPNSSLINNNVGNFTHRNKIGRVDLPIVVPTMVDPEHIIELLNQVAAEADGILRNPAPYVSFADFDSNNFTFQLRVYVPDITSTTATSNAIRLAIYKRFSDEGIL